MRTTAASAPAAAYRVTDRFKVNGEVSEGDLGAGGKLGTEYLYSDRTTLYLNYALENERTDNGLHARKGNMTSGFRTRYSDSASVYVEERYTHGDVPTGLTHSTGVNLVRFDRLNFGANIDFGTLKDPQTGAELKRTALGVNVGYGFEKLKLASAVEYRVDDIRAARYQLRQTDHLAVEKQLQVPTVPGLAAHRQIQLRRERQFAGRFYDGNYTEAVLGYAYRPVHNDRLNALLKYTYFYNVPAADQVTGAGTAADFIQRSHIASVDVMYDLTHRWTVGGKYAYRLGQVTLDRSQSGVLRQPGQPVRAARRLALRPPLGRIGRGAHARPARRGRQAQRGAGGDLPPCGQSHQGGGRLQLQRFLG